MSSFLETYGVAIFTLVLVAILIAFAGPLGMKIKNATTDKVCQTEQIGKDEITVTTGGTVRPAEPAEAVNKVYCIYYDDGEMTISQNEIESEAGRTVVEKGFYSCPMNCSQQMTTVRFVGAVKPNSCNDWFNSCRNIVQFKNFENLYLPSDICGMFCACKSLTSLDLSNFDTSKVTKMNALFMCCESLTNIDLSNFDTSNVTNMEDMFRGCKALTNITFEENFDTSQVTDMSYMFADCSSLTSLDLSNFDTSKVTNMDAMFAWCTLDDNENSVKVSQETFNKMNELVTASGESFFNYLQINKYNLYTE